MNKKLIFIFSTIVLIVISGLGILFLIINNEDSGKVDNNDNNTSEQQTIRDIEKEKFDPPALNVLFKSQDQLFQTSLDHNSSPESIFDTDLEFKSDGEQVVFIENEEIKKYTSTSKHQLPVENVMDFTIAENKALLEARDELGSRMLLTDFKTTKDYFEEKLLEPYFDKDSKKIVGYTECKTSFNRGIFVSPGNLSVGTFKNPVKEARGVCPEIQKVSIDEKEVIFGIENADEYYNKLNEGVEIYSTTENGLNLRQLESNINQVLYLGFNFNGQPVGLFIKNEAVILKNLESKEEIASVPAEDFTFNRVFELQFRDFFGILISTKESGYICNLSKEECQTYNIPGLKEDFQILGIGDVPLQSNSSAVSILDPRQGSNIVSPLRITMQVDAVRVKTISLRLEIPDRDYKSKEISLRINSRSSTFDLQSIQESIEFNATSGEKIQLTILTEFTDPDKDSDLQELIYSYPMSGTVVSPSGFDKLVDGRVLSQENIDLNSDGVDEYIVLSEDLRTGDRLIQVSVIYFNNIRQSFEVLTNFRSSTIKEFTPFINAPSSPYYIIDIEKNTVIGVILENKLTSSYEMKIINIKKDFSIETIFEFDGDNISVEVFDDNLHITYIGQEYRKGRLSDIWKVNIYEYTVGKYQLKETENLDWV